MTTTQDTQAAGAATTLDSLLNDDTAAAHIYPSTLKKFERGEHADECWSLKVGNSRETSVGVFTIGQVRETFDALGSTATAPIAPDSAAHHGQGTFYVQVPAVPDSAAPSSLTLARFNPEVVIEEDRGRLNVTGAGMKPTDEGRWVRYVDVVAALATPAQAPAIQAPEAVARYETMGYALAMRVMQSDLYKYLDDRELAECDGLIRIGQGVTPSTAVSAADGFAQAEAMAARIDDVAAKYASRTEFGEVIFPGQHWLMFVADLATPAPAPTVTTQPKGEAP